MGASRNAARARSLRLREHSVQAPAAMPGLDGVEDELGALLPADGSCHDGMYCTFAYASAQKRLMQRFPTDGRFS